jgi:hypothetical protein
MYGLGGVCGSGECVVWVEVGKSFMWCVVWEGEEGVCGDEFGTYMPPKKFPPPPPSLVLREAGNGVEKTLKERGKRTLRVVL